jgi:hypothetical protein
MEDRDQLIQGLTRLKKELTEKREKLMRPVQELDDDLAGISKTISILLRSEETEKPEIGGFPLRKLRHMTQTQALIEIAKYNGGTIKSLEVKPILIAAKLMKNTKNAAHMVNGAIARSGAFDRVRRGEYRLKEKSSELAIQTGPHGMLTTPGRLTN